MSSRLFHNDFSLRPFATMAIKGANATNDSKGKDGINHERLNNSEPPRNKYTIGILFFFAMNNYDNFSSNIASVKMLDYISQWGCKSFFVNFREFARHGNQSALTKVW